MKQIIGKGKTKDGLPPPRGIRRLVNTWVARALMLTGLAGASLAVAAISFSNSTLFTFNYEPNNAPNKTGLHPNGQMIQASDGNYYGVTCNGGTNDAGVVWKITPAGQETVLHTFAAVPQGNAQPNADGGCPQGVVQGADSKLYGVADIGGSNGTGVVFSLALDGSNFNVMHNFGDGSSNDSSIAGDGRKPYGALIPGADGNFYGTTLNGGSAAGGVGTIFSITPSGTYQQLYSFGHVDVNDDELDGEGPLGNLVQGADGNFYGVTFGGGTRNAARDGSADGSGGGIAYRFDPTNATLTVLHAFKQFDATNGDGYQPFTNLVETADGAFYGMTAYGGGDGADTSQGTLFRISSAGVFTLLNTFTTGGQSDGTPPQPRGLILGSDGNIYGTTLESDNGAGTVFQLVPSADGAQPGALTTVHEFEAAGTNDDSGHPGGPTIQGSDGSILGPLDGDVNSVSGGAGEIFRLAASPVLVAPVQLTLDHATLTQGQSPAQTATLSWNVLNATSQTYSTCFASDSWSGSKGASGSEVVASSASGTPGTYRYALTCGGVETGSATLTILPAAAQTPAPTVTIRANPDSFNLGSSTTLQWSSTNATACVASGGWSGTQANNGSSTQIPASAGNVTYSLTCSNGSGQASASATVTVKPLPTVTISINPTRMVLGNTATLTWSSTNATSCNASNQTGPFSGPEPLSGTLTVQPTTTGDYSYYLSCSSDGGTTNAVAHATVTVTPPAPTVMISANPASITVGNSATLMWSSTNATSCTGSNAWNAAELTSGTQVVQPATAGTYVYTLTCTGDGGTGNASATLTVKAAPVAPTVTISVNPSSITVGSSATLMWSSTNATSCTASNNWTGSEPTSGMLMLQPELAGTYTYTLTCTGDGGQASASTTLTANAAGPVPVPPTLTIGFNPSSIVLGTGESTLSWSSTGATSCDFSGSPVANHATSGSFGVGALVAGDDVYTMTCTGAGGSVTRSATLHVTSPEVVNPPPVNPPPTGSLDVPVKAGGGAFGVPALLGMLGLAGLRRRRKTGVLLLGLALSGIGMARADEAADVPAATTTPAPVQLALDPLFGHLYGGVRLGEMNLARDNGKLYRELHNAGCDVELNQHKNAFAGTAYVGYQLDPLVGLELGYTHRDGTVTTITGAMPANLQGLLDTAVRQQRGFGDIYSASIRLHGEILPRLVLSPRLGTFCWTDKTTAQADGLSAAATHSGGGVTVGTSINYRIWRGLEAGTSIDFFGGNRRNDGTLFAGNVEWDFGN